MDKQNNNNVGNVASKGANLVSSLSFLVKGKGLIIGGIAIATLLIILFIVGAIAYFVSDDEHNWFNDEDEAETEEVYDCSPINFKGTLDNNSIKLTATMDGGTKIKNIVGTLEDNQFIAKNDPSKTENEIKGDSNKEKIWIYLLKNGYSSAAAAGIMGNFQAESGFRPEAIEGGSGAGHGIAQWTDGRWTNLKNYADKKGKSWKNLDLQLEFFQSEMDTKYLNKDLKGFKKSKKPVEAAILFHKIFEVSNDTEEKIKKTRGGNAQKIYDEFKNKNIYIAIKAIGKIKEKKIKLTGNVNGQKLVGEGTLKNNKISIEGNYGPDCGVGNQAIVKIALKEVGYKEQGNNNTKYGEWYKHNGVAWCAIFVSWCADQAGYLEKGVIPKMAYVPSEVQWFKNKGQYKERNYKPKAGDIIFLNNSGHVGIVEKCDGNTVYTIEGNSSGMVAKRTYSVGAGKISGYGTPKY